MSISLCKLQEMLLVKLLEKGLMLGYPMIITKVFEGSFECGRMDIKLKVSDDR